MRTTHAVVLLIEESCGRSREARTVAEHIHDAVSGVTDPEEFMRLAKAVPHEGVQVRAERLPAVTADGRVYDPERPAADSSLRVSTSTLPRRRTRSSLARSVSQ